MKFLVQHTLELNLDPPLLLMPQAEGTDVMDGMRCHIHQLCPIVR